MLRKPLTLLKGRRTRVTKTSIAGPKERRRPRDAGNSEHTIHKLPYKLHLSLPTKTQHISFKSHIPAVLPFQPAGELSSKRFNKCCWEERRGKDVKYVSPFKRSGDVPVSQCHPSPNPIRHYFASNPHFNQPTRRLVKSVPGRLIPPLSPHTPSLQLGESSIKTPFPLLPTHHSRRTHQGRSDGGSAATTADAASSVRGMLPFSDLSFSLVDEGRRISQEAG